MKLFIPESPDYLRPKSPTPPPPPKKKTMLTTPYLVQAPGNLLRQRTCSFSPPYSPATYRVKTCTLVSLGTTTLLEEQAQNQLGVRSSGNFLRLLDRFEETLRFSLLLLLQGPLFLEEVANLKGGYSKTGSLQCTISPMYLL